MSCRSWHSPERQTLSPLEFAYCYYMYYNARNQRVSLGPASHIETLGNSRKKRDRLFQAALLPEASPGAAPRPRRRFRGRNQFSLPAAVYNTRHERQTRPSPPWSAGTGRRANRADASSPGRRAAPAALPGRRSSLAHLAYPAELGLKNRPWPPSGGCTGCPGRPASWSRPRWPGITALRPSAGRVLRGEAPPRLRGG